MKKLLTIEQYKEIKNGNLYRKFWEDKGRDWTERTYFYLEYNSGEIKEITKEEYKNIPDFYESKISIKDFRNIVEIHNGNIEEEIEAKMRYAKCNLNWTEPRKTTLKNVTSVGIHNIVSKEEAKYVLVSNQMYHCGYAVLTATFVSVYV